VTGAAVSLSKSTLSLSSSTIQLGETTTITLQAEDAQGNDEMGGGLTVAFKLGSTSGGQGTLSNVTDNGDGTYTATFTGTTPGSNSIIAMIGGVKVTSTAPSIKVTPGPVSLAKSVATVSSSSVKSSSAITVTLQARDAEGNKETSGGLTVLFTLLNSSGGQGTFSAVKDNNNGTYTAVFTGTVAGTNAIVATIGDQLVTSTQPSITVTPGPVSLATSLVTASSGSIQSGGSETITLQAEDAHGNKVTTGGLTVAFQFGSASGGRGTFSAVKDNKNGTYTATFTGTIVGNNTITATINSAKITSTALPIHVIPGPVSLAKSVVTVSSSSVKSGSTITLTFQAEDAAGNKEMTGGLTVAFALGSISGGQGTLSAVTDNHNGTYTATFTGTIAGNNTIRATISGSPVTSTPPAIAVTPGPVSLAKSVVTMSLASIQVGGTTKVTLQVEDASGNKETTGGLTVLFLLENIDGGQGTFSLVSDNHNGTYTATFKGTVAGSNTISATLDGQDLTSTAASITVS